MNKVIPALLMGVSLSMGVTAQEKCQVLIALLASSKADADRTTPEIRDKSCIDSIAGSALRFDDKARPIKFFRQGMVDWSKDGENDVMDLKTLDGSFRYVGKAEMRDDSFGFEGVDAKQGVTGKIVVKKAPDGKVNEFYYSYSGRRYGIVQYRSPSN